MVLPTPRLILRPVTEDDAADIFAYCSDEQVGPAAGWMPHRTLEQTREIMQTFFLDKQGVFGIELRLTHRLIGTIGLVADPKREWVRARMLGYSLSRSHWGCGYATEAAREVIRYGFE